MYGKNAWEKYSDSQLKEVESLSKEYELFITKGKTEREFVKGSIPLLKEKGFVEFKIGQKIKEGDKIYFLNKNKNIAAYIIGKKPLLEGLRILGAHIDSPRLDVKQNPLYENGGFSFLDTHYYGGIKKYQWVTIPLALYGVVIKKDGTTVDINIGDNEGDPVFGITDLLIHLSADQMAKKVAEAIPGENLDLMIGNKPLKGTEKDSVKANILKLLKEKYAIEEEDFLSAELEIVPSGEAKDFGLDRSMICGYGHDDKCCAYTSLRAVLDLKDVPEFTSCAILVDKEEVGSIGATGAQSRFFENTIASLLVASGNNDFNAIRTTLDNAFMLSSDVSAGYDPLFPSVMELKNSCFLGNGVVFNKYTGARGKSGCNDANPEYIAWLRNVMDNNSINFQTAELGKVDQGGGGTIAYILGNLNMNVIDAGIPVLNMHSPMEIISKADLFETYQAYIAFLSVKK